MLDGLGRSPDSMDALVPILMGYGVGSLPLGYLVASHIKGIDLRRVGSGNVGATNMYRAGGLAMAILVVLVDVAKGAGSVVLASRIGPDAIGPVSAGVAAIVGHVFPVWLRFRGGKGVATACGVFWMLAPIATAMAASIFIATVWMTRYVSLGSIIATAVLPTFIWTTSAPAPVIVGSVVAAALVIERHRPNVGRLRQGTERRLGQKA
jgi:glycerol-3-phosphate acyltransferase PlsY